MCWGSARGYAPSPLRVKAHYAHEASGISSLGFRRPTLSFSLSLKLSPLMLIVIEWWRSRSRIALAIKVSPRRLTLIRLEKPVRAAIDQRGLHGWPVPQHHHGDEN